MPAHVVEPDIAPEPLLPAAGGRPPLGDADALAASRVPPIPAADPVWHASVWTPASMGGWTLGELRGAEGRSQSPRDTEGESQTREECEGR